MDGHLVEVYEGMGLKVDAEVFVDGMQLEHVSEFNFLGFVLDQSGTDGPE